VKLQPDPKSSLNTITRTDFETIEINAVPYRQSLLVMPEGDITAWPVSKLEDLTVAHFQAIADKKPELVIFGSGKKIKFPPPSLLVPLIQAKIGIETMDTLAACRTYNILMGEGRHVLAALILETTA
jgi:uncharacterized protein